MYECVFQLKSIEVYNFICVSFTLCVCVLNYIFVLHSLSVYIHMHMHIHVHIYICIYIYIYIHIYSSAAQIVHHCDFAAYLDQTNLDRMVHGLRNEII